jgi:hypothetical protein
MIKPGAQVLLCALLFFFAVPTFAQTAFTDKVGEWKKQFPKSDVVATTYKQVVDFLPNPSPKPGEGKVKASVREEITLVPLKDFIKYEDGLFYYDEISLENLKGSNPEGKDIKIEKLCSSYSQENIFHSDLKLCVVRFPLAEKGKAFTYSYQNNYRDIKFLTSFYFHHHFPALERVVQFNVPSWMEIDLREFNFTGNAVEKTSATEGDITRITYRMKAVPAYTKESQSPNHAISYPHLICVSKAFTANGQRQPLFESVKDVYGWYNTVCSDIGNQPEVLKAKVTELTEGKKTDLEKVESLFYWVQDNIRYIAFENGIMGFKPDAAQNVFKNKYGDCKGKANLLKEMLKLAGFDARLTWIGTSDLPYDYSLPSLAVDNHMICTVFLGGKKYFLDGTESHIALNDYAQRIQGKQVLIEDGRNYILEKVPLFHAERNKKVITAKMAVAEDDLVGTSTIEYNGESKIMVQSVYSSVRNDDKNEVLASFLKGGNDNIVVADVKTPDLKDRQKPLQISFGLTTHHQVTKAGNEIYVAMDWNKEFGDLEMPEDRKNDFEFRQKYHLTTQTELAIPSGYKVTYLPAAFKKTTPDYSFEGAYLATGNAVVYKKTIVVNKAILRKQEFVQWNAFLADINKFYNDQVVFAKQDPMDKKQEATGNTQSAPGSKQPASGGSSKPGIKKAK